MPNKTAIINSWIARIGVAAMLLFAGVAEVVGAALVLMPKTRVLGGLFTLALMGEAIVSDLASLVPNDEMLPLAVVLFAAGAAVALLHRGELPIIGKHLQIVQPKAA